MMHSIDEEEELSKLKSQRMLSLVFLMMEEKKMGVRLQNGLKRFLTCIPKLIIYLNNRKIRLSQSEYRD